MQDERLFALRKRLFLVFIVIIIFLSGLWWLSHRQERPAPERGGKVQRDETRVVAARGDLAGDEKTAIEIFQSASPAVVYITSVEVRRDMFTLNIFEIPAGTGSGFVWDKEGRVVTNFHVIEDASRIEVTLADGTNWKASLVGVAPEKDLAVVRIEAPPEKLSPIPLGDSRNLLVGQKVFAIGNPFGLDQTMTSGIVSALGREIESATGRTIHGVVQTDAAINPGNSGGPLLDSAGRLVGVNTAIYSPTGASAGIGFAVPVEAVREVVPQIIQYGRVIHPGVGVTIAHETLAARLGVEGVLIIDVFPDSTAEKAGLRGTLRRDGRIVLGDVVQSINGKPVSSYDDLRDEFDRRQVGEEVSLGVLRNGKSVTVKVTLEEVK